MIRNVAIYCRVSTEEQKKFGISVNDQKNSLTQYCKNNNYKIYDYYIDEGVSAGTISKRKEFVRLLKDLDNIDLIIFTKLDRFSRNVRDANNLLQVLDEHNTSFRAIDEDDIDTSTADGRFIFNLKVNLAEHERNKDSERIRRVNKYKYDIAKTVCSGKCPYGYKISSDKKLIIDKEKAENIRLLYKYYAENRNLNKARIWFSNNYENRSIETIKKYLSNTCYIGKYKKISGEIIENFCESIIDIDLFNRVQNLLNKNIKQYTPKPIEQRRHQKEYIFTGLLKCPICMRRMSGRANTSHNNFYDCRHHYTGKCTFNKCISELSIERHLLENIEKVIQERKIEIININKKDKNKKINTNIIVQKMDKLTNLYLNELVNLDYYKTEYEKLKIELNKAKENNTITHIDTKQIEKIEKLLSNDFFTIYNTLDNLEKRRLWSSIIDYIIVYDKDELKIIVY